MMKKTIRLPKHTGRIVAGVLAFAVLIAVLLVGVSRWESRQNTAPTADSSPSDPSQTVNDPLSTEGQPRIYINGRKYLLREDIETVLLLGVDKYEQNAVGSYNNNQRADFLMLLVIDRAQKTYSAVHLNRDTMTLVKTLGVRGEVTGSQTQQLALAHAYGSGGKDSCENTAEAVSNLLYGIEVQHYACITMDAIAVFNDQVGGVTVTLSDDFTAADPAMKSGETLTLKGDQARIFVQSRKGLEDSTNLYRMERQRTFLTAFLTRAKEKAAESDTFFAELALSVSAFLESDMTVNEMSDFANCLTEFASNGFFEPTGEAAVVDGYMQFTVDEQALRDLVLDLFYKADDTDKTDPVE